MSVFIGANIKLARRKLKWSQAETSKLCGWSHYPSRISNYERGIREPKSVDLLKLAKALNISVDWLYRDYGVGQPLEVRQSTASFKAIRYVPLLRFSQIAEHLKGEAIQSQDMLPIINVDSSKAFAIVVEGNVMESSQGDSFAQGSIIFVDPSLPANHGDYVVAMINGTPTFKQIIFDSGQQFLKPLNHRYPILECQNDMQVVGVVRMMMKSFR